MGKSSSKCCLIKSSKSKSYYFCLSEDNEIILSHYNQNGILEKKNNILDLKILDFSADIDKSDRIHLVCITTDGNFLYNIMVDGHWSSHTLTKFDIKSNKFNYLTLRVIKNDVHIFYGISNLLNSNLWTIVHAHGGKRKWNKANIISMTPGKSSSPYHVDFDKLGNIHLIYEDTFKGTKQIYYTNFNPFLKRWMKSPQKISDFNYDNLHPYVFADNNNTLHALWLAQNGPIQHIFYKQMPSSSNAIYDWKSYSLPQPDSSISHAIMLQDNGILRIIFKDKENLKCLHSKDYGFNWDIETSPNKVDFSNFNLTKYSTNQSMEKVRMNLNHIYASSEKDLQLFNFGTYNVPIENYTSSNDNNNDDNIQYSNDENQSNLSKTSDEKDLTVKDNNSSSQQDENKLDDSISADSDSIENQTPELINNEVSPFVKELNSLSNEAVKTFIENTKVSLDSLLTNTDALDKKTNEIEKVIFSNIKELDRKIFTNSDILNELKSNLTSLELLITQYKAENNNLQELLKSIEALYYSNTRDIKKIEEKIKEIHRLLENSATPALLDKFKNIFK
ncbi:hypothetical protein [Sporosalibacterium faouarense]|uniref:hypothetical protein n=1 Tax=Sporosalibacterium faouarense TaxID=516123 RepID=UPI00192AFDD5|nr:hypothetical protein [Sporosalibacterium faouarense]